MIDVNLNFTTPEILADRLNEKRSFVTDYYKVYINDSFLHIIDPNDSRGVYTSSIVAVKKAFSIWENRTRLVQFELVNASENYTLYVEWSGSMHTSLGGTQTIAFTQQLGYGCDKYFFVIGGEIVLMVKDEASQLAIMTHEIGHILNLGDVGNTNALMGTWYDENNIPSEEKLKEMITPSINDTLKMIIHPEYDCS
jgi:hypothetical protein